MPFYPFRNVATGELREFGMPMLQAPRIGSIVTIGGNRYERLPSLAQIDAGTVRGMFPFASRSLPRKLAGCKHDAKGHPIVRSARHQREIMARLDLEKD